MSQFSGSDAGSPFLGFGSREDSQVRGGLDKQLSGLSLENVSMRALPEELANRVVRPLPRRRSAAAISTRPEDVRDYFGSANQPAELEGVDCTSNLAVPPSFDFSLPPSSHESRDSSPRRKSFSAFPSVILTPPKEKTSREGNAFSFNPPFAFPPTAKQGSPFTFHLLHNISPAPTPSQSPQQLPRYIPSLFEPGDNHLTTAPLSGATPPPVQSELPEPLQSLIPDEKVFINARETRPSQPPTTTTTANRDAIVYDVNNEETPREPFFDPIFQDALRQSAAVVDKTISLLKAYGRTTEMEANISRLVSQAEKLKSTNGFGSRTIAVVGDSGEGKSSVINSLLHMPGLAKTGEIGTACTSVVTEYRQREPRHKAPLTIEVDRLTGSEIEELVGELVHSYRRFYLSDLEKATVEEYSQYETESEVAGSTLEAAFMHKNGFSEEFLQNESPEATGQITRQLVEWTHDLPWPGSGKSDIWEVDSTDECNEKTAEFMKDRLWPFTRSIRVYLSAQVLKTGIVLADLPGLRDTNLARVRATENYLHKCDHIFVVTRIHRANTSQSVKSSIYGILRDYVSSEWEVTAARNLKVAVVCTKSEDMDTGGLRRDFVGPEKSISTSVMDELDRQLKQAKMENNRTLKKKIKRRQEYLLIEARNDHVSKGLRKSYAANTCGGAVNAFCVSNRDYEKFCRQGDVEYVLKTGIPELRRFCHSITATSQLLGTKNYLQSSLPGLLNSIKLVAEAEPGEDSLATPESERLILDGLRDLKTEVAEHVRSLKRAFESSFEEQILRSNQRIPIWRAEAEKRSDKWNDYTWNQYKALCLHNGNHYTEKLRHVNWNSQLIWKMRSDQEYSWEILVEDEISEFFDTLISSIRESMRRFGNLAIEHIKSPSFRDTIKYCRLKIEYKLRFQQLLFKQELNSIRQRASSDNYSSYVQCEMTPAYRAAAAERGTGTKLRQQKIVQGKIKSDLLENIALSIQQAGEDLTERAFSTSTISGNAVILPRSNLTAPLSSHSTHTAPLSAITPPENLVLAKSINDVFQDMEVDLLNLMAAGTSVISRTKQKEADARKALRTGLEAEEATVKKLNEMISRVEKADQY